MSWTPVQERPSFEAMALLPNLRRKDTFEGGHTFVVGWDWALLFLLLNALVDLCWGIALTIFAAGVVPVYWGISQWGKDHVGLTNTIVTLIATLSTIHVRVVIGSTIRELARVRLLTGFTLQEWEWMQGVQQWSIATKFDNNAPRRGLCCFIPTKWQMLWLIVYAAMALHSASIVAIMQPQEFVKFFPFNDAIPCGVDPNTTTFGPLAYISVDEQSILDSASFGIGLQLGDYYDTIAGNTTTAVLGRVYVKEIASYAAIGGLKDGLHEVPGVIFDVQCINTPQAPSLSVLWGNVFPSRSTPTVTVNNNSVSIFDTPITNSSELQSVATSLLVNSTSTAMAFYGLVNATGSGGVVGADANGFMACAWNAVPKLVHVQTVDFIAHANNVTDADTMPEAVGRAVLNTLQGMAQAASTGASLQSRNIPNHYTTAIPSTSAMLRILLSDGVKATLTGSAVFYSGAKRCNSHNRTVAVHWRFGNEHNLGWIAIVFTSTAGVIAVVFVFKLKNAARIKDIDPLTLTDAFSLGGNCDNPEATREAALLYLQDGKVVIKG